MTSHFPPITPNPELEKMIEAARKLPPMAASELRAQCESFTFGNVSLGNPNVTREVVTKAYDRLHSQVVRDPELAAIGAEIQRGMTRLEQAFAMIRELSAKVSKR